MQFYLNGYKPGDPFIEEPHASAAARPGDLPADVDVLIAGCGPAGLVLAAQMANFPTIRTVVIDQKDGPLEVGQADGVACRTVEMFEAFGLADHLLREAYWVNEVAFWRPDPEDLSSITRFGRVQDTEDGLSEFPHAIVNQARLLAYLRAHMAQTSTRLTPFYGLRLSDVEVGPDPREQHPVTVTLQHMRGLQPTGETSTIRASYVVGCDGSRSATRTGIGRELVGDVTSESWGVMDVLAVTDFPDIRVKCAIYSANQGNILIIPREGGYLARFYVQLDEATDSEMLDRRTASPEKLAKIVNRIIHPYSVVVKDVGWWSVYEVGQRLCEEFDDAPIGNPGTRPPRVFIAGDAAHTHSAKAGQGMNVAMADAWNLGWKLGAVLTGTAEPGLLRTYSEERQAVAQELIDFDREFSRRFSARAPRADGPATDAVDPEGFRRYFVEQGRFTAGVATRYGPSMITAQPPGQVLAKGFPVGMRFHSAPVVRLADAKRVHLGHIARADGAWRLYVFADQANPIDSRSRARKLCEFLESDASPISRFTRPDADRDSVIDVRAVFQQSRLDLPIDQMPAALLPRKGTFGLVDYEKMFCPDPRGDDIFELRQVNRETGCVVVVRPDQYVSDVVSLQEHEALSEFFARILIEPTYPTVS